MNNLKTAYLIVIAMLVGASASLWGQRLTPLPEEPIPAVKRGAQLNTPSANHFQIFSESRSIEFRLDKLEHRLEDFVLIKQPERLQPAVYPDGLKPIPKMRNSGEEIANAEMGRSSNVELTMPKFPVQQTSYQQDEQDEDDKDQQPVDEGSQAAVEHSNELGPEQITKSIQVESEKIKADSQLDEATKSDRLAILATASEWVQKSKKYRRNLAKYKSEIKGFEEALAKAKQDLKEFVEAPAAPKRDPLLSTDRLQVELQQFLSELEVKRSELEVLQSESQRYTQRITEVPKSKSDAQQRLKEVMERLEDVGESESELHDETDLLQVAIRIGTEAELKMLNVESQHLELSAQLSPFRIDLANRKIKQLEVQVEQLKRVSEEARNREVQLQIELARKAAMDAHPMLAEMAERNQELAKQRKQVADKIAKVSSTSAIITEQTLKVEVDLASITKKVEQGLNKSNSLLLAETRRKLTSPWESRSRLSEIQAEMQAVSLAVIQLEEERELLADPESWIKSQLGQSLNEADSQIIKTAEGMVQAKRELLGFLLNDYRSYGRLLGETEAEHEKLIDGITATEEFLSKHMLWVQSAEALSINTLQKSSSGVRDFFRMESWCDVGIRLLDRLKSKPHEYLACVVGFFFLFVFLRRLKD